jgi:hypothetical protein
MNNNYYTWKREIDERFDTACLCTDNKFINKVTLVLIDKELKIDIPIILGIGEITDKMKLLLSKNLNDAKSIILDWKLEYLQYQINLKL